MDYSDQTIRSVAKDFQLPKILRLYGRHRGSKSVKFSRINVYLRDEYVCQYCYRKFVTKELTFDHVIPISKGGLTTWENIVTSCSKCNTKKGDKTPREAGMKLLKEPRRPNWTPSMALKLKKDDPDEWFDWFPEAKKSIPA